MYHLNRSTIAPYCGRIAEFNLVMLDTQLKITPPAIECHFGGLVLPDILVDDVAMWQNSCFMYDLNEKLTYSAFWRKKGSSKTIRPRVGFSSMFVIITPPDCNE